MTEERIVAHTWAHAERLCFERGYGVKVELLKERAGALPARYHESTYSLRLGAEAVYRDRKPTDSIQVRDYGRYWELELERYNPDVGSKAGHALADATGYTLVASLMMVAAYLVVKGE